MCSSMKQPKPDRLVEIDGIPITVHSANEDKRGLMSTVTYNIKFTHTPRQCAGVIPGV